MRKYFGAFTMDVICACAYGIEINSLENTDHPMLLNARKILDPPLTMSILVSAFWPELARVLRCEPFSRHACDYFADLTDKTLAERKRHNKYLNYDKCMYY